MEINDSQLVLRCREGRQEAYQQLLSRYEGYIYSLCLRLIGHREDALDQTQEAMIKVVAGLSFFQVNRPFKPWLRQVVVNSCLNFLRKSQPVALSLDQTQEGDLKLADILADSEQTDPSTQIEWLDTRDILRQAVGRLPFPMRTVLILRHQEGMGYREIAQATGMPLGTVKTNLYRARGLLRQSLSEYYGWEDKTSGV